MNSYKYKLFKNSTTSRLSPPPVRRWGGIGFSLCSFHDQVETQQAKLWDEAREAWRDHATLIGRDDNSGTGI
jgi:hypothetical protein